MLHKYFLSEKGTDLGGNERGAIELARERDLPMEL